MGKFRDLTGQKFGKLFVISRSNQKSHCAVWNCVCDCGTQKEIESGRLLKGWNKSCGCNQKSHIFKKTHDLVNTKEYRTWRGMKKRCSSYPSYLANGIKVCDRWMNSFEDFLSDVGRCPPDKNSLDRIENKGHYEPGNWRWATTKEQNNNYSQNREITFNGITKNITEWAEIVNIKRKTIYQRLRNGWSETEALTTPVQVQIR